MLGVAAHVRRADGRHWECEEVILTKANAHTALGPRETDEHALGTYAFVIGLPVEASLEDTITLFDPVAGDVSDLVFLSESVPLEVQTMCGQSPGACVQSKRFALATFPSDASLKLFSALYHNMPMLQYKGCAPLIVVSPYRVTITIEADPASSTANLSNWASLVESSRKVSPGAVSHAQLPTCSLCIRRIRLDGLHAPDWASEDIIVGRSFVSDPAVGADSRAVRCGVCLTYFRTLSAQPCSPCPPGGSSLPPLSRILSSCAVCSVHSNLWACLVCGSAGCGRYTGQHAQGHYLQSHHRYAQELVSGRVWDYGSDQFVHFENSSSIYGGVLHNMVHFTDLRFAEAGGDAGDHFRAMNGSVLPRKMLISSAELRDQDRTVAESLGPHAAGKMHNLTVEYEHLIELQLQEQQLYYEKMLARETMRAMELSYMQLHAADGGAREGKEAEREVGEVEEPEELDEDAESDLQEIEALKVHISAKEAEYRALLDEMKILDEATKKVKAENNALFKRQKQLMTVEEEWCEKTRSSVDAFRAQVEDMEHQITDLSFYLSTREQVKASPLKDELAEGVIITSTPVSPTPAPHTQRGKGSGQGRRKR